MESAASSPKPVSGWARHLVFNCFWLLVPLLAANVAFLGRLPPSYQADVFWKEIPLWIAVPEKLLRVLAMALPWFLVLELRTRLQRWGLALFVLGALVYCASWASLIVSPDSAWSRSAVGFVAPAYTPALWFAGLVLLGERFVLQRVPYHRWMFAVVAGSFLVFHIAHAALVFTRVSGGWAPQAAPRVPCVFTRFTVA